MHKENPESPKQRPKALKSQDLLRLLTFGWYFAASIGVGIGGGILLDNWLDTKPWFLLAGLTLGSVAGFYGMYKMLRPLYQRNGKKGNRGDRE